MDVDIQLSVADKTRRFDLAVRFATDAPFAVLYGPSGAGKTLTLQAIAGLLQPHAGHIRFGGRTLYDSAHGIAVPAHERQMGYLLQNYALFPHLTVRENVAFGLRSWPRLFLRDEDKRHVQSLLDSFGIAGLADSRPSALSGGQQQRVALARALACKPQVLLLDEPFAALNPQLRHTLRQELAQARKDWGIPALMITHEMEDVLELADVAFVFGQGHIVREIDLHTASAKERLASENPVAPLGPIASTRFSPTIQSQLRGWLSSS
jgi:molybdate transport system ATP-binding protein